ncbi:MAG: ABC transporter substrate-binding protein [Desulfobacterales bacterium]|nr:ABC transporter substrate-binding protein [Desulfobacterales bacterium]
MFGYSVKWKNARLAQIIIFLTVWIPAQAIANIQNFHIEKDETIVDQSDRQIKIQKPFKRIISLYGAHTENLFLLGLSKEIIGVSPHEIFPEEAKSKTAYSYHDDPEKFLAAHPDLVLIRPMIDRGYAPLVKRLETAGITIISLQPANLDEMYCYWQMLGILSGKQKKATDMIKHFKTAVSDFKALTSTLSTRKRVYFEAIHTKMKTFAPDAMAIFALEIAGGINIAGDAKPVGNTNIASYGKERILSHADRIDVYLAQTGSMNRPTLSMIKQETGFKVIKAVRENQIFIIDEMLVSRPTFRLLNGIDAIGQTLYPDLFNSNTLKILKKAKNF